MKSVRTLIDMAREKVHADAELARRIGVTPQNLAGMRAGRRPISPETVAALCDVLELPGEEARQWLALAVIENPKNSSRAEMLKRALFACWALGVVALPTLDPSDAKAASTVAITRQVVGGDSEVQLPTGNGRYAHCRALRALVRWLARVVTGVAKPVHHHELTGGEAV